MLSFGFSVTLFLLFSSQRSAAFPAREASKLGYLFVNGSKTAHCYDPPENIVCPRDVVNYPIVDFDSGLEIIKIELQGVRLGLLALDFLSVKEECLESVREYSCSNTFSICSPGGKYGVKLTYDVARTEKACKKAKSVCPPLVQDSIIYNCSIINKNVQDYAYCISPPKIPDDVCPESNYKYPKALVDFYPLLAKGYRRLLAKLSSESVFTNVSCQHEFSDIYCQLLRGSICSNDMTLRLYKSSKQDCKSTVHRCISPALTSIQGYFIEMCKMFPENTAERVPLPSVERKNVLNDVINI